MNFQKIIEPPTTIKVALRIKPTSFSSNWLEIKQDNTEIILKKQTNKNFNFKFDKIFDQNSIQQEIYQKCAKSLVDAFIFGFNSTILAYGQTGSGKTFTMGTTSKKIIGEDCLGILPRLMNDIWNYVKAEKILRTKIKVSFLEIYNEEIMDLLLGNTYSKVKSNIHHNEKISIREGKNGKINIFGLTELEIQSYEQMLDLLQQGCLSRATSSTLMNQSSSRSHAIFTIYLEQQSNSNPLLSNSSYKFSKFHLVDLAGSERMKKTGAKGNTLREGIHINRGLLALGNVITSLSKLKSNNKKRNTCFRDSKLTRVLQDSMGGNSQTYMIACISGEETNFEESMSTLYYASRTRLIVNKPFINDDPSLAIVAKLNQEIFKLKEEIIRFKRFVISDKNTRIKWENQYFDDKNYEISFNEEDILEEMTTGPSLMEIKEISEENYIHVIEDNQKLKETISKITKENNEQKNSIKKIKDNVIEKKEEFEKRLEYFKSNNFYVIA